MKPLAQNLLHLFLIIIIASIFWVTQPSFKSSAHGIILPVNSQLLPQTSIDKIRVYDSLPIIPYKNIGLIRIAQHFSNNDAPYLQKIEESNLLKAKQIAAKAGANGLIISAIAQSAQLGPLDSSVIYAQAILS